MQITEYILYDDDGDNGYDFIFIFPCGYVFSDDVAQTSLRCSYLYSTAVGLHSTPLCVAVIATVAVVWHSITHNRGSIVS